MVPEGVYDPQKMTESIYPCIIITEKVDFIRCSLSRLKAGLP